MRRFLSRYDQAYPVFLYLSKSGQIMGGSLAEKEWRGAVHAFRQFEKPQGEGLVHLTLSLPSGMTMSDAEWHDVSMHVLQASGLPPDLVPWVQWGRERTTCDHIHIVAGTQTFTGRTLDVSNSLAATDRLERDLCQRFSLPEPLWRDDPGTILNPQISKRSRRKTGQAAWFATDVDRCMTRYLPTSLDELNDALDASESPWEVTPSPDRPGLLVPRNILTGRSINPRDAGTAFGSSLILKRIALAARLQAVSLQIVFDRVFRLIRTTPHINKLLKGLHDATNRQSQIDPGEDRQNSRRREPLTSVATIGGRGRARHVSRRRARTDRFVDRAGWSDERSSSYHAADDRRDADAPETGENITRRYDISDRHPRRRAEWLIAVYNAARKSGVVLRHRFGLQGSAITLIGDGGNLAAIDMVERHVLSEGDQSDEYWQNFLDDFAGSTGCTNETELDGESVSSIRL